MRSKKQEDERAAHGEFDSDRVWRESYVGKPFASVWIELIFISSLTRLFLMSSVATRTHPMSHSPLVIRLERSDSSQQHAHKHVPHSCHTDRF